ncbi:hypothetical protein, partial [Pectobacterium cacticida]
QVIKCVHMDNRTMVKSAWFNVFGDNGVYGNGANARMDDLYVWCDENGNVSSLVGYPMSEHP